MKKVPPPGEEKYPRKTKEGPKMDYSGLAFPKPKGKKKKKPTKGVVE